MSAYLPTLAWLIPSLVVAITVLAVCAVCLPKRGAR